MMFGMGLVPFETRVPQSCSACPHLEVNPHSDEAYCMREDGKPTNSELFENLRRRVQKYREATERA